MSQPKTGYHGVHRKPTKIPTWGAQITMNKRKEQLGTFRHPKEAARAYDCMAIQHYGSYAILNFEEDRAWAHKLAPEGMRIATRAEEKEHRRAERDLARRKREEDDPMVLALRENPAVMAL